MQKNSKINDLQRWLDIMGDVETYAKNQEAYDRTLGKDIRDFVHTGKKKKWSSHSSVRKRKRKMTGIGYEERGTGTSEDCEYEPEKKRRKLVHSVN